MRNSRSHNRSHKKDKKNRESESEEREERKSAKDKKDKKDKKERHDRQSPTPTRVQQPQTLKRASPTPSRPSNTEAMKVDEAQNGADGSIPELQNFKGLAVSASSSAIPGKAEVAKVEGQDELPDFDQYDIADFTALQDKVAELTAKLERNMVATSSVIQHLAKIEQRGFPSMLLIKKKDLRPAEFRDKVTQLTKHATYQRDAVAISTQVIPTVVFIRSIEVFGNIKACVMEISKDMVAVLRTPGNVTVQADICRDMRFHVERIGKNQRDAVQVGWPKSMKKFADGSDSFSLEWAATKQVLACVEFQHADLQTLVVVNVDVLRLANMSLPEFKGIEAEIDLQMYQWKVIATTKALPHTGKYKADHWSRRPNATAVVGLNGFVA